VPVSTRPVATLTRAAGFVLLGAAIAYAVDAVLMHGLRERRVGLFAPWNAIVEGRLTTDLVVFGSSRAVTDVDCAPLTARLHVSCFNLGLEGSPVNIERPLVDVFFAHNAAPRFLLMTVDVFTFRVNREPYDPSQYLPYLSEAPLYENLVSIDPEWRLIRRVPLYGFAKFGLGTTYDAVVGIFHMDRRSTDTRIRGWWPRDWPWDGAFDAFVRENPHGKTWPIEQPSIDALESILRTAESRNVRPVLVYPPEYVEAQHLTNNRDAVFAVFHEIAARHRVPFIDFSDDPLSADRSLFYNAEHMNRVGAELFSQKLADRMAEALR
jgi:hypothetical protein